MQYHALIRAVKNDEYVFLLQGRFTIMLYPELICMRPVLKLSALLFGVRLKIMNFIRRDSGKC